MIAARRAVALAAALTAVAGCSTVKPVSPTVAVPGMPNPELALQKSIQQVDTEMQALGTMTVAQHYRDQGPVLPAELEKLVAFTWQGSLDDGVRKLADSVGYSVSIDAPEHPKDLTVSIATQTEPVADAFRDIGNAAGPDATVQLDPLHRHVAVIHHV